MSTPAPPTTSTTAPSADGGPGQAQHTTTTTLVPHADVAAAVAAAAAAAGLAAPPPGVPATPYTPARAQAVADEVTRGTLARLAGLGRSCKWVVSAFLGEGGSGAGCHAGSALCAEAGDGGECFGVGGDGLEGVVSVWWVRV
jgi:hypothetical protein